MTQYSRPQPSPLGGPTPPVKGTFGVRVTIAVVIVFLVPALVIAGFDPALAAATATAAVATAVRCVRALVPRVSCTAAEPA